LTPIVTAAIVSAILINGLTLGYFFAFQQSSKSPTIIGIAKWQEDTDYDDNIKGFKKGLEEFGYIEGKDTEYIVAVANADKEQQRKVIQDFIDKKVDLIYSLTTPGTLIAKEMTQDIPIVFTIVTYPVEAGVIANIYGSENNLVGTTNYVSVSKHFDLFYNIYPVKKIGFLHRNGEPNSSIQLNEMKEYASKRGVEVIEIAPNTLDETSNAVSNVIESVDAVFLACDTLIQGGAAEIATTIAMENKKPTFSCLREGVITGALVGNVTEQYKIGIRAGQKASLILEGAKPENLYTEHQENEFIIINLKTANMLNIEIPEQILVAVDEVIR